MTKRHWLNNGYIRLKKNIKIKKENNRFKNTTQKKLNKQKNNKELGSQFLQTT